MTKERSNNFDEVRKASEERIENYDILKRYDYAMMEYFKMWIPFRDEDTGELREGLVPTVLATPRREQSGSFDDRRNAQTWEGDFPPTQLERIIYPGMTLTRLDATYDQSRFAYTTWRNLGYSDDLNSMMVSNFPLPYNFLYQLDFWVDTYHDYNVLLEQYARKFPRPTWWLDIKFPIPWDEHVVHIQDQGVFSSQSILEGGEIQRDLRAGATVNLFGWIPLPVEWARTIQRFSVDIIDSDASAILEVYETTWADKQEYSETGEKWQVLEWA